MPLDINLLTAELSNLLSGVYRLERYLYDMYLDDVAKDVTIQYRNLNGGEDSVTIPNIAKLKSKFDDIENQLLDKASCVNVLQDVGFSNFSSNWSIQSTLTYSTSVQTLTSTDKYQITNLLGEDIFTPPNNITVTTKLVIQIDNPNNREDLLLLQSATAMGLTIFHPKSLRIKAFINPNGTGWTNNIDEYIPNNPRVTYPFQLMFGDLSQVEVFYPVLYPVYNKGLPPVLP